MVEKIPLGDPIIFSSFEAQKSQYFSKKGEASLEDCFVQYAGKSYQSSSGNYKKSLFSRASNYDLSIVLNNARTIPINDKDTLKIPLYPAIVLTKEQKDFIALSLIENLITIHDREGVHQDVKCENVLLTPLANGNFLVRLIDFRNADIKGLNSHPPALSSREYASPQIFFIHEDPQSGQYNYFHKKDYIEKHSYGYYIAKELPFYCPMSSQPDPTNDMWALGILLLKLYDETIFDLSEVDSFRDKIEKNMLVKKLLEIDPRERFTAREAYEFLLKTIDEEKVLEKKEAYVPHFQAQGSPIRNFPDESLSTGDIQFLVAHTLTCFDSLDSTDKEKYCRLLASLIRTNLNLAQSLMNAHLLASLEEMETMFSSYGEKDKLSEISKYITTMRADLFENYPQSYVVDRSIFDLRLADQAYNQLLVTMQNVSKTYLKC